MSTPSGLPHLDQVASFILTTDAGIHPTYCPLPSSACKTCICSIDNCYCAYALVTKTCLPELLSRYPELAV